MKLKVLASGSNGNCYIITDSSNHQLIIECGIDIRKIIPHIDFDNVDGCIVSHNHQDHCLSVNELRRLAIDVYGYDDMQDGNVFQLGNWKILPVTTLHSVPCYSFIVYNILDKKRLLFVTDTYKINCNIAEQDFDLVMIEANYSNKYVTEHYYELTNHGYENHLNIEAVTEWLNSRQKRPKRICLIHLSRSGNITKIDAQNEVKATGYDCDIAESGLEIDW